MCTCMYYVSIAFNFPEAIKIPVIQFSRRRGAGRGGGFTLTGAQEHELLMVPSV